MGFMCRGSIMMKKISRIAVCYQARSQADAGKYEFQLRVYWFHVQWLDYDEEMCMCGDVGACVIKNYI